MLNFVTYSERTKWCDNSFHAGVKLIVRNEALLYYIAAINLVLIFYCRQKVLVSCSYNVQRQRNIRQPGGGGGGGGEGK